MMAPGRHILTVTLLNGNLYSPPAELSLKKSMIKYPQLNIHPIHPNPISGKNYPKVTVIVVLGLLYPKQPGTVLKRYKY